MTNQHSGNRGRKISWGVVVAILSLLATVGGFTLKDIWPINDCKQNVDGHQRNLNEARDKATEATGAVLYAEKVMLLEDSVKSLAQAVSSIETAQSLLKCIPGTSPIAGEVKIEQEKNISNLARLKSVLIELKQNPVPIGSANLCVAKQAMYGKCEKLRLR
jgi:hypothetical protein